MDAAMLIFEAVRSGITVASRQNNIETAEAVKTGRNGIAGRWIPPAAAVSTKRVQIYPKIPPAKEAMIP